jgi:hypothetical protein
MRVKHIINIGYTIRDLCVFVVSVKWVYYKFQPVWAAFCAICGQAGMLGRSCKRFLALRNDARVGIS